ncbi:hypothetical protein IU443_09005 [Nocardia farcinica]|uniref:DUF7373 family lipoprotein n=1 Tax=Nocardia farcinica TaxID=37329 RepID=UPI0018963D4E|nr:hypothetical protein [Nocardia farcinica]MBF6251542.1 hypothetical protein [Nocardia farcinica]MBF6263013.1 hypothetical protein [Nocardia farcinica]MBF6281517.1 hypothetical protein [Nocardia farcinica]MBF6305687.1 hypothetical protein [Nocardia farcinica]MBF6390084.1 hypothetical protein [Nocardia farcinica]
MVRTSRIATIVAWVAAAATLAGCGAVSGTALPAEPDVRRLEVGTYPVTRHSYDQNSAGKGALLEGMRMSEAVVPTVTIDPSLKFGRGSTVLTDSEHALDFLAKVSKPVLDNRKFVTGFAASGADEPDPAGETRPAPDTTAVTDVVLRFPDEATAKLAARELEDADIGVSPENQRLGSTKYPDAYIHWRPGIANVGAFIAHRQFVVSLFIQRPRADSTDLVKWIDKTLDAQLPALDRFQPTPVDRLDTLKVDPDGLLARVVVAERTDREPDPADFAIYGPNHAVHVSDDESATLRLVEQTGADKIAVVDAGSVTRVRDAEAAPRLIDGMIDTAGEQFDPIDAPKDVPGAKCLQLNDRGDLEREYKYRCYVPYKRYVGIVTSDKEPDVRQKVAAQYALFANSL